ncbi:MAG: DUF1573 domain-containing protein [Rhodothermaceae bacterium]|nr:DUF1573 domain-containing protein [Rhodothermaceae bacterium]
MKTLYKYVFAFTLLFGAASTAWTQESTFFLENFDGVTPPALPFGWEDASGEWTTSSSVASSGSGGNNLTIAGAQPATIQTPVLNLAGLTSGTIEYLARRTSTYPQDSLVVWASTDGGTTFSITLLDRGEALPAGDGSYEMISMTVPNELLGQSNIVLQFSALGGTTSGSNLRIDDVQIVGEGDPTAGNSIFGFSTEASTLDQATGLVEVPVFLDFENVESLQGLQIDVSWDVTELTVSNLVPGTAIDNAADWSLTYNTEGTQLDAVLLGNEGASLAEGVYDPLFTIEFSLPVTSSSMEALVTLNTVIGSLAVATGDDAGLLLGQQNHTITLDPGDAVFSPDATELDAGTISTASTAEVALVVTNTGNSELVISDVVGTNTLFSVSPITTTIAPGLSQDVVISFTPSFTAFGLQSTILTFQHNAAEGSTDITVSGTGTGGRGDASQDGAVDVLDLVLGIDYALGITVPDANQLSSADLFPFDAPDGGVDVRDLTVLSQAILSGTWPDGLPLPVLPAASAVGGKKDDASAHVQSLISDTGSTLTLSTVAPVRGVQFTIAMDAPFEEPELPVDVHPNLHTQWLYDAWAGELRVLAVRMDGGYLGAGDHALITLPEHTKEQSMQLVSGMAIIEGPERISLGWLDAEETTSESEEVLDGDWIGVPYPNPASAMLDEDIRVPVRLTERQHVLAEVFDLLGRRVALVQDRTLDRGDHVLSWNGSDHNDQPMAAGMYLLRVTTAGRDVTRVITIR